MSVGKMCNDLAVTLDAETGKMRVAGERRNGGDDEAAYGEAADKRNLLVLTYRLHQEENDGLTTVYRWDGSKDVGREQSLMVAPPAPAEAGRSLGWAERCVQCLPIAPVASEAAERQVLASDANEMVFGPLERAIAGCFRNLRVV